MKYVGVSSFLDAHVLVLLRLDTVKRPHKRRLKVVDAIGLGANLSIDLEDTISLQACQQILHDIVEANAPFRATP